MAVSDNRLLYVTAELSEAVHISGTPQVTVRLAASKPAANLSVALIRLPWTSGTGCNSSTRGTTTSVITRGWADPQNHSSLTDGEPLVPGEFYDVSFALQPDDQVIPAGSRIGLMIFSTDHEFTIHPTPGTELTVDLAGTSVELPVLGGPLAMPVCESRRPARHRGHRRGGLGCPEPLSCRQLHEQRPHSRRRAMVEPRPVRRPRHRCRQRAAGCGCRGLQRTRCPHPGRGDVQSRAMNPALASDTPANRARCDSRRRVRWFVPTSAW